MFSISNLLSKSGKKNIQRTEIGRNEHKIESNRFLIMIINSCKIFERKFFQLIKSAITIDNQRIMDKMVFFFERKAD